MIIFDFDGCLMDTATEMAVSAYRSFSGHEITTTRELPPSYLERFRRNRPLIHMGSCVLPLAEWCLTSNSDKEMTIEEFSQLLSEQKVSPQARKEKFFKDRTEFMRREKAAWFALQTPYQPLWQNLQERPEDVIILTNKNRAALVELCDYFGLAADPKNMFSSDSGSKLENFAAIRSLYPQEKFYFLEDFVETLIGFGTELPGAVTPLLASWGYVTAEQLELAQRHKIKILNQEELVRSYWNS